jgi:hypothetical protein
MLDVAALANWLALRAVDQKAKRVEALEQAAREHPGDRDESTGSPAERDPTAAVPAPALMAPRTVRPNSAASPVTTPVTGPLTSPAPGPLQAPVPSPEPRVRRPTPTVEQAPLLPPPIDIRPPPPPHGPRG